MTQTKSHHHNGSDDSDQESSPQPGKKNDDRIIALQIEDGKPIKRHW
eukprot:CAMPEP_0176426204 /NCGR_PEP_ID=MMETSP0127-20121128/11813_1 /TAXON_ID=938130 /ORGANISM="Platyophrya macrostoma, Strain WH" /LENGTH=46 /DNA_ID= /DNA_START= /DNA_END= /DNA_ORIENTATION=